MTKKLMNYAKTSGGCDKFSTRFSYENLIDGTAIVGSAYEQNQNLSEGSAEMPLTAVGTLTSLRCNSSKVYENLLKMPLVLKLAKVLTVAAVLSAGMVSESRAVTCEFKNDPNNEGKYILTVKGDTSGSTFYGCNKDSTSWDNVKSKITSASFDNNVTSIGNSVFMSATSLKSVDMPSVTSIEDEAFRDSGLKSINLPSSLTNMGTYCAFCGINNLEIIIPDDFSHNFSLDSAFDWDKFGLYSISCKGDIKKCENIKVTGYLDTGDLADIGLATELPNGNVLYNGVEYGWREKYIEFEEPLSKFSKMTIKSATKEQCTGSAYYWNGTGCAKEQSGGLRPCASGYVDYNDECLSEYPFSKKRWTPAEANQWLKDDDNEITITFKK